VVELPTVNGSKLRFRSWVLDVIIGILAAFLAFFTALPLVRDPGASAWEKLGTFITIGLILIVTVFRGIRSGAEEMKFQPIEQPKDLLGWADGLHQNLCMISKKDKSVLGVRIAIHKVVWNKTHTEPKWLEQITQYVGGDGGAVGRKTSARAGIIGRVARTGTIGLAKRTSSDLAESRQDLVGNWGFTALEARAISADRWAWLAIPLLQEDKQSVYGVVYLDSQDIAFFDDSHIQDAVFSACSILAKQTSLLYNRTA
jgi:hypothetical protein